MMMVGRGVFIMGIKGDYNCGEGSSLRGPMGKTLSLVCTAKSRSLT